MADEATSKPQETTSSTQSQILKLAVEVGPQRDSDKKITAEPDNPDYQASVANALAAAVLEWRSDPTRTEARQP